jgi:hypothetical protein
MAVLFGCLALTGVVSAAANFASLPQFAGMVARGGARPMLTLSAIALGYCVATGGRDKVLLLVQACVLSAVVHAVFATACTVLPAEGPLGLGAVRASQQFRTDFWPWRATGMFGLGRSNALGAHFAFFLPLAAVLLVEARRVPARTGWLLGGCLLLAGIVMTQTRASVAAAALGLGLLGILSADRRTRLWLLPLAVAGAVACILALPLLTSLETRRLTLFLAAWGCWLKHPLFGVGPGRYVAVLRESGGLETAMGVARRGAHNSFLTAGAEQGLLAPLLIAAVVMLAICWTRGMLAAAPRSDRLAPGIAAAFAVFAVHNLTNDLFLNSTGTLTFWLLLGAAACMAHADPNRSASVPVSEPNTGPGPRGEVKAPRVELR